MGCRICSSLPLAAEACEMVSAGRMQGTRGSDALRPLAHRAYPDGGTRTLAGLAAPPEGALVLSHRETGEQTWWQASKAGSPRTTEIHLIRETSVAIGFICHKRGYSGVRSSRNMVSPSLCQSSPDKCCASLSSITSIPNMRSAIGGKTSGLGAAR